MAGRKTRPVAAALASPIAGFWERPKFIVKTTLIGWRRVDGMRLGPAGTCFYVCGLSRAKGSSQKQYEKRCTAAQLARSSQTFIPKQRRIAFTHSCPRGRVHNTALRESSTAHAPILRPPRSPQRSCMRSSAVVPRTKLPRPTEVYRSVVCTYLCASLLVRILATILETCSLSELLKGRALRAVPSLGTASYKTCYKHGAGRRH